MTIEEKAANLIMRVWLDYARPHYAECDGRSVKLHHACMSSGEDAAAFLQELGYGEDTGWTFVVNDKGLDLMDKDIP